MQPTEYELTVAVDAAARANYEIHRRIMATLRGGDARAFDDLAPAEQLEHRNAVLAVIGEVLEALPDRAEAERRRIGTYVCLQATRSPSPYFLHRMPCERRWGRVAPCTCGLADLLEQLLEVDPL